jgi:hypothetical protein
MTKRNRGDGGAKALPQDDAAAAQIMGNELKGVL